MMDKGKAYSILVTWADFADNPLRAKWCANEMTQLFLKDLEETTAFISVQKDHTYLDLISGLLPELCYQFQSWDFADAMEKISDYQQTETWQQNLERAKTKIKRPRPTA